MDTASDHNLPERADKPVDLSRDHDRLMEERNILQLEGSLFCFDPREAKRQVDELHFHEASDHPVTVVPHPRWGRPQGLAYKILQAIFLKLVEEGYPYPEEVAFSQRELARLVGWQSGGWQGRRFYEAVMQLHSTQIQCFFYNSETKEWRQSSFYVLPRVLLSGKDKNITHCVFYIDPIIARSLRRRHVVFFNMERLKTLDPMGMVLFKRIFFGLLLQRQRGSTQEKLLVHKDYEAMCHEWLGGLKPERYRSRIDKQLGPRFRAISRTGLTRKCGIEKRESGHGFKFVARPGKGFDEDYEKYYVKKQQQLQFKRASSTRYIQHPMELVSYFHELLGHKRTSFNDQEVEFASQLLDRFSYNDLRDFVEYAIEEAKTTRFAMQQFGAARQYVQAWDANRERRAARDARQAATKACPHCGDTGHLTLRDRGGAFVAAPCPHDLIKIEAFEQARGLERA